MKLNELVTESHNLAKEKGWWENERSPLEVHMLIVSELAEATEEARKNTAPVYLSEGKPDGEAVELADAVIRITDYFGHKGWDLEQIIRLKMDYNKTRSYRHGGKNF